MLAANAQPQLEPANEASPRQGTYALEDCLCLSAQFVHQDSVRTDQFVIPAGLLQAKDCTYQQKRK